MHSTQLIALIMQLLRSVYLFLACASIFISFIFYNVFVAKSDKRCELCTIFPLVLQIIVFNRNLQLFGSVHNFCFHSSLLKMCCSQPSMHSFCKTSNYFLYSFRNFTCIFPLNCFKWASWLTNVTVIFYPFIFVQCRSPDLQDTSVFPSNVSRWAVWV